MNNDDGCIITFDGTRGGSYYVSCQYVKYINKELCNTGSNTITLYPTFNQGVSQSNISIPSLSYPYYTSNTNRYYITDATNIRYNAMAAFYKDYDMVQTVLLCIIGISAFIRLMLRR